MWTAVTVRVAWELMLSGLRVRPAVLTDARDHVLLSLPNGTTADEAEVLAGPLTHEYIGRVTHQRVRRIEGEPDLQIAPRIGWRRELARIVDPIGDAVFRLHCGDGMSMEDVERTAAIDGAVLSGAREGLREAIRDLALRDGVSLAGWNDARVDHLLARVASVPEPGCPEPMDILSDHAREHADLCPRCSRGVRLIRGGLIAPSDLVPSSNPTLPTEPLAVAAMLLHPDARKARRRFERALGTGAVAIGSDAWLMSEAELALVGPSLKALVEEGTPPRHHVRGAIVRGWGRWSGQVLLGPVAVRAIETARSRPWSDVDGMGELPSPRPPPPRSTRWWFAAGMAACASIVAGIEVLGPRVPTPLTPIHASFEAVEDGWEVTFDADDLAVIDVVSVTESGPTLLHRSVRETRGQWSTGEGNFRLYVPGASIALIASESGLDHLSALVKRSRTQPMPMAALEEWVRSTNPAVDWVGSPAITPTQTPLTGGGSQSLP